MAKQVSWPGIDARTIASESSVLVLLLVPSGQNRTAVRDCILDHCSPERQRNGFVVKPEEGVTFGDETERKDVKTVNTPGTIIGETHRHMIRRAEEREYHAAAIIELNQSNILLTELRKIVHDYLPSSFPMYIDIVFDRELMQTNVIHHTISGRRSLDCLCLFTTQTIKDIHRPLVADVDWLAIHPLHILPYYDISSFIATRLGNEVVIDAETQSIIGAAIQHAQSLGEFLMVHRLSPNVEWPNGSSPDNRVVHDTIRFQLYVGIQQLVARFTV